MDVRYSLLYQTFFAFSIFFSRSTLLSILFCREPEEDTIELVRIGYGLQFAKRLQEFSNRDLGQIEFPMREF